MNMTLPILPIFAITAGLMIAACQSPDKPAAGRRTINVVGIGKAKTLPDQVEITIKAEFTRPAMRDAVKETQNTMDEVLLVARKYVKESFDIKTSSISANKDYDYDNRGKPIFKGYQASQAIDITIKDISRFEKFSEEILATRVSRIENLAFSNSKEDSILREVDLLAIDDAFNTAKKICERTHVKLGPILHISNYGPTGEEDANGNQARRHGSIGLYGKGIGGRGFQISPDILVYSKTAFIAYEIE
jgi:uncharacterized protein